MREDQPFLEKLKASLRRDMTWEEFITPLVEKGICDEDGNVLVSMPPPPRTVFDEQGNARVIYPDLSQPPPPPPRRAKPKPRPRAKADAKAKLRGKKAGPGGGTA